MGRVVHQHHLHAGMSVGELVDSMGRAGAYNGGALARAVEICMNMIEDDESKVFCGLAGAMVPAGCGGIVEDLIRGGYVDILVSTGANLTHDLIEALGCHHYQGTAVCSDVDLRSQGINRIYDVFLPDDAFVLLEEYIQERLENLGERCSITEVLRELGSGVDSGILAAAADTGTPVFCPAIQDSIIGLQVWLFTQTHRLVLDATADMQQLIDHCFDAVRAGAILIGGGVPKNYILQSMLMTPKGFDYAVQLTGDRPDTGGLSGATLDEARSWGKVTGKGETVTVYGDATITLPLLVAAVLERLA
ncbi:MAG: deoxyhypusine synthase [Methanoculleaceae archaeon]